MSFKGPKFPYLTPKYVALGRFGSELVQLGCTIFKVRAKRGEGGVNISPEELSYSPFFVVPLALQSLDSPLLTKSSSEHKRCTEYQVSCLPEKY